MEAKLKYLPQKFLVLEENIYVKYDPEIHGDHYVFCCVTGEKIFIKDLLYWNIERQEAYIDYNASLKREIDINAHDKC